MAKSVENGPIEIQHWQSYPDIETCPFYEAQESFKIAQMINEYDENSLALTINHQAHKT